MWLSHKRSALCKLDIIDWRLMNQGMNTAFLVSPSLLCYADQYRNVFIISEWTWPSLWLVSTVRLLVFPSVVCRATFLQAVRTYRNILMNLIIVIGTRGGAVGGGTALQAGRSRVRFPMMPLEFFTFNSSGRTMALGLTQPLTEMSTRDITWGLKAAGA